MRAADGPRVPLGEAASVVAGRPRPSSPAGRGPRLVRGENVGPGALRWADERRLEAGGERGALAHAIDPGDALLALDRPLSPRGTRVAPARSEDLPAVVGQRVARLRAGPRLDASYLRWALAGAGFQAHVRAMQQGTTVPHLSPADVRAFPLALAPLEEQRRRASLLDALFERASVGRASAEAALSLADALFERAFGGLGRPPGWRPASLLGLASYADGLELGRRPPGPGEAGLPVVRIAELRAGRCFAGGPRASERLPEAAVVADGSILLSWSGTLLADVWAGGVGALNQHIFRVTPAPGLPPWLVLSWLRRHLPALRAFASGKATTTGHLERAHLASCEAPLPPPGALDRLDAEIGPLFARAIASRAEARVCEDLLSELLCSW